VDPNGCRGFLLQKSLKESWRQEIGREDDEWITYQVSEIGTVMIDEYIKQ
jgi:hypothetical protein